MPKFAASNSSRIFFRPSVPFPIDRARGTVWIISLSQVRFSSTSTTPVSKVLAPVMMMSRYHKAMSAVGFCWVIAVIAIFAFLLAFMIQMCAGIWWWKNIPFIADAIVWSIILGSGRCSSLMRIRRLAASIEHVVGDVTGLATILLFGGRTICHRRVGFSIDVVGPFVVDVALSVGVCVGLSAGSGFHLGTGFGFGFGIGVALSCLPECSCWLPSGFFGQTVWVRSPCITASRPTSSVSALLSSLWSRSVEVTTIPTMTVMPLPNSRSSCWYASQISSVTAHHVFIPCHCVSCSALCVCSMFAICAMVRWSCASLWAGC